MPPGVAQTQANKNIGIVEGCIGTQNYDENQSFLEEQMGPVKHQPKL